MPESTDWVADPRAREEVRQLELLLDETTALFHRLRAAAEQIHHQDELTGGLRGVLRDLARHGPQTVPRLARRRPVSRQHIQVHVNRLLAQGLVELVANPAHRRSSLVRLTPAGEARFAAMQARESTLLGVLRPELSAEQLHQAYQVLRQVRARFESPDWQALLDAADAPTAAGRPSEGDR